MNCPSCLYEMEERETDYFCKWCGIRIGK
ncbi:MAG TPA: hypothetical protein ENI23_15475 [bacterium]|nr:hypothetical protein [bacterium]